MDVQQNAWIELDRKALKSNVQFLNSLLLESCDLMPAIKANAYGNGAALITKKLQKMGIHEFCVACVPFAPSFKRKNSLNEG